MWPWEDCLQAPAAMLLVCSESQKCCRLTSSLGQALAGHLLGSPWGRASWPGVLQTLKYPSYPREALWDLHLCWASPIPYLACPTPFHFLKKVTWTKSSLGILLWGTQLRHMLIPTGAKFYVKQSMELTNVTDSFSSQLPSLKILSQFTHWMKYQTYLAVGHLAESNFRAKSREVICQTCHDT